MASSSSTPVDKSKDKGKFVVDGPIIRQPSSTLEALQRSVEFRKGLEKAAVTEPQPKRKKFQEPPPKERTEEEAVADPQPLPQQVKRVERLVQLEQLVPHE